jgi:glycosyltransferase involved in cell wall biosynthesis
MKDYIKFSIITVCKNSEKTIEKTIKSVIEQTYKNIEYIIIDGKSTDNTAGIIKKYINKISHYINEEDNGIYDAMNKGVNLAKGDYISFLNADDRLFDELSIERVCKQIKNDNSKAIDVFYGAVLILDQETRRYLIPLPFTGKGLLKKMAYLIKIFQLPQIMSGLYGG